MKQIINVTYTGNNLNHSIVFCKTIQLMSLFYTVSVATPGRTISNNIVFTCYSLNSQIAINFDVVTTMTWQRPSNYDNISLNENSKLNFLVDKITLFMQGPVSMKVEFALLIKY